MNFWQAMNTAVYSTLGSALGSGTPVYYQQAKDNAGVPYVVFNWQSAIDENATPSRMWNTLVNVRSFASYPAQSGSIDALIDGALVGKTINVTGWTNFWTSRTLAFSDVETLPNGEKSWVSGGLYRIRIGK